MKKFLVFFILLLGLSSSFSLPLTHAVEDNATIEGNMTPLQYSEELYVVRVTPADESRDIQFNVYSRIGKISSQEQNIPRGVNYVNFYLKFFPPLYKIDEKYTLEVVGGGLIGRSTLTIIQDPSVIDSQKMKEQEIIEEKERQEEQARLDKERAQQEEQARLEQERMRQEEQARLDKERAQQEEQELLPKEKTNQGIIPNEPTVKCGVGTVLENGLCVPIIVDELPKNDSNDSEIPNWIYLLPIVFLIIIITIAKKARKRNSSKYTQKKSKQNKTQNKKQETTKSQDTTPPRYDERTIESIRQYNHESTREFIENKPENISNSDIIELRKRISKLVDQIKTNDVEITKIKKEYEIYSNNLTELKKDTDAELEKLAESKIKIKNGSVVGISTQSEVELKEKLRITESEIQNHKNQLVKIGVEINNNKNLQDKLPQAGPIVGTYDFLTGDRIDDYVYPNKSDDENILLEKIIVLEDRIKFQNRQRYEQIIKNYELIRTVESLQLELLEEKHNVEFLILQEWKRLDAAKIEPVEEESLPEPEPESEPLEPIKYPIKKQAKKSSSQTIKSETYADTVNKMIDSQEKANKNLYTAAYKNDEDSHSDDLTEYQNNFIKNNSQPIEPDNAFIVEETDAEILNDKNMNEDKETDDEMRCKTCKKTFKRPPPEMREDQICTDCRKSSVASNTLHCRKCGCLINNPSKGELKYEICSPCGKSSFPNKSEVKIGDFGIIRIHSGPNEGRQVRGKISEIITPGQWHYEGLLVKLEDGITGRLKEIVDLEKFDKSTTPPTQKQREIPKNKDQSKSQSDEISKITRHMVNEYVLMKSRMKKSLKMELIGLYLEKKSLKEIKKSRPYLGMDVIRYHTLTPMRLPPTLKEIISEGGLHSDPKLSIVIAAFAADYLEWEEKKTDEKIIVSLAQKISKCLIEDKRLGMQFEE